MARNFTLGFDTADAHISLALLEGDALLADHHIPMDKGQGEQLFAQIKNILKEYNLSFDSLCCIGVGIGPGNFTGIRLGVAAARGLSMALGIPAVGISTFQALAHGQDAPCLVVLDARRGHLYVQRFSSTGHDEACIVALADLPDLPSDMRIIGSLAQDVQNQIGGQVVTPVYPLGVAIARLAYAQRDKTAPPPAPLYLRKADAALPSSPSVKILP